VLPSLTIVAAQRAIAPRFRQAGPQDTLWFVLGTVTTVSPRAAAPLKFGLAGLALGWPAHQNHDAPPAEPGFTARCFRRLFERAALAAVTLGHSRSMWIIYYIRERSEPAGATPRGLPSAASSGHSPSPAQQCQVPRSNPNSGSFASLSRISGRY